jgi:hypothetical protein
MADAFHHVHKAEFVKARAVTAPLRKHAKPVQSIWPPHFLLQVSSIIIFPSTLSFRTTRFPSKFPPNITYALPVNAEALHDKCFFFFHLSPKNKSIQTISRKNTRQSRGPYILYKFKSHLKLLGARNKTEDAQFCTDLRTSASSGVFCSVQWNYTHFCAQKKHGTIIVL